MLAVRGRTLAVIRDGRALRAKATFVKQPFQAQTGRLTECKDIFSNWVKKDCECGGCMWPLHNSASLIGGVQEGVQKEREEKKC